VFKKAFLRLLFFGVLFLLLFSYCGASGVEYSITVNGEEIHGLQGVACATGGLLAAGVAVVGVLALVALVLAGASMVLLGVFAVVFLGLLFVFFPVWVVVGGVVILMALVFRKHAGKNPANTRCW
jgi:hypothetical protein